MFTTFISLSSIHQYRLEELLKESSQFNSNDLLVNANEGSNKLYRYSGNLKISIDDFPKSILRETKQTLKESGVNSLCLATATAQFDHQNGRVSTPIILTPLSHNIDKVTGTITIQINEEDTFLNPFLLLKIETLDIPFDIKNCESDFDQISDYLIEKGVAVDTTVQWIGNFHHHRFQVIKELEELISFECLNPSLTKLLGSEGEDDTTIFHLPPDNLFPADTDHEIVFEKVEHENLVIQGPPGTGKSQVISNLLGKFLKLNKSTIVVSEKHVALEVLTKKLAEFNLDRFSYIASADSISHHFLQDLKSVWSFLESYQPTAIQNIRISEQLEDNLQMTLDLLNQDALIGGVSYRSFHSLRGDEDLSKIEYVSRVPEIPQYKRHIDIIKRLFDKKLHRSLAYLKPSIIRSEKFDAYDVELESHLKNLTRIQHIFSFSTWSELDALKKKAAVCQVFENEMYRKYKQIFTPSSRAQKKFNTLRKKHTVLNKKLELLQQQKTHWKTIPSKEESNYLIELFSTKIGFFQRRKLVKFWNKFSDLPLSKAEELLSVHRLNLETINSYSQIIVEFCELGIESPEIEIDSISAVLSLFSEEQWHYYSQLPTEKIALINENHHLIGETYSKLRNSFNLNEEDIVGEVLTTISAQLGSLIELRNDLIKLDDNSLALFSKAKSKHHYLNLVLKSHLTKFKEHFPNFAEFDMASITEKIEAIHSAHQEEANLFAVEIKNQIHSKFREYHELLNTPARKLDEDQKELKKRLRKGKSILVKEFAKTRSHPSLRELYDSDAREWIRLLKPIWLSNPSQLAKCFPMELGVFDIALFDEASQIPLQNALGAVQRSKRIIVAGDEHQMGPNSYFKSGSKETVDLLHQANYYWTSSMLKHHYRSVHPDLIAFSNEHFYNNQLKAYPEHFSDAPIRHHFIASGKFIERKNVQEAQHVARQISQVVHGKDSFGIVAFSEEQLNCIWDCLDSKDQQLLNEKRNSNQGFFKALENVQGDECDHLIVSFGYGRNEDGDFHMRFGPMNSANGRKRLNVLLTRAIKTIDFYCSIKAGDFKLSDNESINLLRQWVTFSENYCPNDVFEFPFDLNPHVDNTDLSFEAIYEKLPEIREVVTLDNVLSQRGWNVKYT